jgi:hypothetical protein
MPRRPRRDPRPAGARLLASAGLVASAVALTLATAGCNRIPRRATQTDCVRWADHFGTLAKKAYDEVSAQCWAGGGLKFAASQVDPKRKLVLSADLDYGRKIDQERKALVDQCTAQDGARYYPPDADCFLGASNLHDWRACTFKTPFFVSFQDVVIGFEQQVTDVCGKTP